MTMWRREHLGGKNFLVLRDYLPLIPVVLFFSAWTRFVPIDSADFWLWLVADIIALSAMAGWFVLGRVVFFPHRSQIPAPVWAVVGFGAVLGALKGVVTAAAGVGFGLEPDLIEAIGTRVVQTTLTGAWVVPATSFISATLAGFTADRDEAIRARVRHQLGNLNDIAPLVKERTAPLLESLIDLQRQNPVGVGTERVRALVDDQVRPLSRTLWSQASREYPSYRPWQLYAVYLSSPPRIPWLAIGVWALTSWPTTVAVADIEQATTGVILGATLLALFHWLGVKVPTQGAAARFATILVVSLVALFTLFLLSQAPSLYAAPFGQLEIAVGSTVWVMIVTMTAGALQVLTRSRRKVREDLRAFDAVQLRDGDTSFIDRKLAVILHNDVQNRLLALADKADVTGTTVSSQDLRGVLTALSEGTASNTGAPADLTTRLAELVERWRGVVTISLESIPDRPWPPSPSLPDTVLDVLTEALTNAVRHGLASEVSVTIGIVSDESLTDALLITVDDDGVGPRRGSPGLGSHLLDTVSSGQWSLSPAPQGGSRLQVAIDLDLTRSLGND